jgi:hypothetical protein
MPVYKGRPENKIAPIFLFATILLQFYLTRNLEKNKSKVFFRSLQYNVTFCLVMLVGAAILGE